MKLIIIFGPEAVGKTTIAYELAKYTNLKFYNERLLEDLQEKFIGVVDPYLTHRLREDLLKGFVRSKNEGLIIPYKWNLANYEDDCYLEVIKNILKCAYPRHTHLCFIELAANKEVREQRNNNSMRKFLKGQDSFPPLDEVESPLNRYNSFPDEFHSNADHKYLYLDTTYMTVSETVRKIMTELNLYK